jgi:hypothetical protein
MLDLARIRDDGAEVRDAVDAQRVPLADEAAQKPRRRAHDLVRIDRARLQELLAAECEQLSRQRAGLGRRAPDLLGVAVELVARLEPLQHQLAVAGDRGEDVVEVVRDAAGEASERVELLRVPELGLEPRAILLGALALGDVDQEPLHPACTAVQLVEEVRLVVHPDDAAVAGDVAVLLAERLAGGAEALRRLDDPLEVVRVDELQEDVAVGLPLLRARAEQRLDLRADVAVRRGHVVRADVRDQRQLLDERPVTALGLGDPVGGLTALGDVLDLGDEVQRVAVLVAHERDAEQDPDDAAVLAEVPLLHPVARPLAGDRLLQVGEVGVEIVGMRDVLERQVEQLVLGVADDLAEGGVHLDEAPVRADERHPDRRRVEGAAEALVRLAQQLVGAVERAAGPEDQQHRDRDPGGRRDQNADAVRVEPKQLPGPAQHADRHEGEDEAWDQAADDAVRRRHAPDIGCGACVL